MTIRDTFKTVPPYELIKTDTPLPIPQDGIALCLSGGGYRAMLYHLGVLWRLNDLGYLPRLTRITSVSGGTITAALLALKWDKLGLSDTCTRSDCFDTEIAAPILKLASKTVDIPASIANLFGLRNRLNPYRHYLEKYLFKGATLQDIVDTPRFVFTATNVQSGALWRFMKPRMRDWRVGDVLKPKVKLSFVVIASSAFPPILSPISMKLKPKDFQDNTGFDLSEPAYQKKVYLTDGGVYDNLGIETSWKKFRTIFVSDAGWPALPEPKPRRNWVYHTRRISDLMSSSLIEMRKRQIIESFKLGNRLEIEDANPAQGIDRPRPPDSIAEPSSESVFGRNGAYWGIERNSVETQRFTEFNLDFKTIEEIRYLKTRLRKESISIQRSVIDWGYITCNASISKYYLGKPKTINSTPYDTLSRDHNPSS